MPQRSSGNASFEVGIVEIGPQQISELLGRVVEFFAAALDASPDQLWSLGITPGVAFEFPVEHQKIYSSDQFGKAEWGLLLQVFVSLVIELIQVRVSQRRPCRAQHARTKVSQGMFQCPRIKEIFLFPFQKLRRMAYLHLEALGSNRDLAIVFQTELRHSAKFLGQFSHKLLVEYFDLIKKVLREGQESGVFRSELSVTVAAHCFFGAVDEIVTTWILSDRNRDDHLFSLADVIVDIVLRGIEPGTNHGS